MNVQTIIDNYGKIDKSVRVFTFLYFLLYVLLILPSALDVIELNEPMLYTYDVDYGIEPIIEHGVFALFGCAALLPVIFLMPFDRFNGFYGFVKMFVYVITVALSMGFIVADACDFEDLGYAIENAALMNHHIDSVLTLFTMVCVATPIIFRYVEQLKNNKADRCQTRI
jgi:hypothetical protein